jgi:RHS repeat-associated protein
MGVGSCRWGSSGSCFRRCCSSPRGGRKRQSSLGTPHDASAGPDLVARNSHRDRGRFSSPTRGGRYCRARYYHPQLQRFISEDSIGFTGGDFNLYAYARNNPVGNTDPLGLTSEAVCIDPDSVGSFVFSAPPTLAGRKDGFAPALPDQSRILLAAAPRRGQLSRCLDACEASKLLRRRSRGFE